MNIRGKHRDIVSINLVNELKYSKRRHTWFHSTQCLENCDAYNTGFGDGIRFIAKYLKAYNITLEVHDKEIPVVRHSDWLSGDIVDKPFNKDDDDNIQHEATLYAEYTMPAKTRWYDRKDAFVAGYKQAIEDQNESTITNTQEDVK